jgi:hypothetical protein
MNVSASPTAPFSLHSCLLLLAAVLCFPSGLALAQATGSDYTVDLPTVERVKGEIKGSDPTDTLARQVAVFTYLYTYVDRIKLNRDYRGPYTPGETRVMTAYRLAAYQISQDYAKSHTPAEAAAFERLHGQYEMNSEFYKDWSKRLIGRQSAAAYKGAEAGLGATQQAHIAQEQAQYQKDVAAQQASASGLSSDPTAVATRRCLELGGDSTACVGKGFVGGFMDMIGFGADTMSTLTGPARTGVVLSGLYHNPNTLAAISFGTDTAAIQDCGKLVADGHAYAIHKSPAALDIVIQNEPHPIQLSMRPDGALAGPGPVDVKGRIIIGYHTVVTQAYLNGQPVYGGNCNGPCTTSTQVPDYAPKIERCNIASLAPPPPSKPASAAETQGSGMIGMLTGMMSTIAPVSEPGLRMVGKYNSSSGLMLDFGGDAVILDCGSAHVKQPYTVENSPAQILIHVRNSGGPFTLALAPDNTLRGMGSTTVNGRLVSGMNGDNVTYKPSSQQCNVATLTPASANSSTSVAANIAAVPPSDSPVTPAPSTVPASISPAATSAPTPGVTTSPAPTSTRAAMRVVITSTFASATNPMAGQPIYIMRERIDEVLRKLGVPVPPNSTPGKAMQSLATACHSMDCGPVMTGLNRYYVTAAKLDSAGKATLSATAATGAYFLFALVRTPNGSLIWDIPTNLSAGDNTITLSAANAEVVQ